MLRAFIYNELNNNFVEAEENLLFHDLCAILDEEEKVVYLWNGPRSNSERLKRGIKAMRELTLDFPEAHLQLKVLDKDIPRQIQKKLGVMLTAIKEKEEIERLKFSRFTTVRVFFVLLIIAVVLPIIATFNLILPYFWAFSSGNLIVSAEMYENWIFFYRILIFISSIAFMFNLGIGIFEQDNQVIIFSIMGLITCVGITIYLGQGIFLFLFQEGSTSTLYFLSIVDVLFFTILNMGAILIFEIPNAYKLKKFYINYREFIF